MAPISISPKFIASLPPKHAGGEGEPDPHANYRVDQCSYLVIDGDTREYSVSMEPKEIPQGFHITQHQKLPGLRKFKVVQDGADTYDIVYVGTLMIQNGFAYIAGEPPLLEEPPCYLMQVWFPPFAVSFPLECPAGITNKIDYVEEVVKEHRDKLIKSIEESGNDTTKRGMLDFDMTKKHVLYPPHPTCPTCQAELLLGFQNTRCPVCDDTERGQVDHKTVEQVDAGQEMKAEIKNLKALLNKKETEYKDLELEIEAARAQVRDALMKVGCMTEEIKKSNRKAERVAEQLEALQATHAETKAELRELKVLIASVRRLTSAYADLDDDILEKRRRVSKREDADKV